MNVRWWSINAAVTPPCLKAREKREQLPVSVGMSGRWGRGEKRYCFHDDLRVYDVDTLSSILVNSRPFFSGPLHCARAPQPPQGPLGNAFQSPLDAAGLLMTHFNCNIIALILAPKWRASCQLFLSRWEQLGAWYWECRGFGVDTDWPQRSHTCQVHWGEGWEGHEGLVRAADELFGSAQG